MKILEIMQIAPVIPVIAIEDISHAVPLARALVDGGLRVLEITLRTEHGLPAIRKIADEVPGAVVGVGTLTQPDELARARDAGALFGVSPGLTRALIEASRSVDLPLLPGVMTPSEIMTARDAGFVQMKLFPAVSAGGVSMLRSLAGPFPDLSFCPTGGVTLETASSFLALSNVPCVGGSWLTPRERILAQDWNAIQALAAAASSLRSAR